jgi:hypothetical protein
MCWTDVPFRFSPSENLPTNNITIPETMDDPSELAKCRDRLLSFFQQTNGFGYLPAELRCGLRVQSAFSMNSFFWTTRSIAGVHFKLQGTRVLKPLKMRQD